MKYQLSKTAVLDLDAIYCYGFIQFGETQADRYAEQLENGILLLCMHPLLGRLEAATSPAIRRFECENHIIFYDVTPTHVLVIRVLHGATDYLPQLSGEY